MPGTMNHAPVLGCRSSGRAVIVLCGAALAVALFGAGISSARRVSGAAFRPGLAGELRGLISMPGGPPGAIAILQRGRQMRIIRAGVRDVRTHAPVAPNLTMRLASISKAFSGAVALALVQSHCLRLSDTIAELLPALPSGWGKVTLSEALQHTSGLPDFTEKPSFVDFVARHPHATPSPRFVLRFIAGEGLEFAPGSRYRYSNTDNFIVALMAEAVAHRSYEQLLNETIFAQLRTRHTSLPSGPQLRRPYLHGYVIEPPAAPEDVSTALSAAYSWASGGLITTPAEMNRFVRAYVGARLFSRAVQAEQFHFVRGTSGPPGPSLNFAGLAIFRYRTRCGAVYGHTGNTLGYTQFMAATPDGERSVTVSVSEQISDKSTGAQLAAFHRLRAIEGDAVCAVLR